MKSKFPKEAPTNSNVLRTIIVSAALMFLILAVAGTKRVLSPRRSSTVRLTTAKKNYSSAVGASRFLKRKSSKSEGGEKASNKSNKSSKSSKTTQRNNPGPTRAGPIPAGPTPADPNPTPITSLCPPDDDSCITLFSENYENPNYDFSDPSLNTIGSQSCLSPEGSTNAFFHCHRDCANSMNLAYGKDGIRYSQPFTVEVFYLQEGVTVSDNRGGKYAISMLSTLEDDRLELTFAANGRQYFNFGIDIAPLGLDPCNYGTDLNQIPTDPASIEITAIDKSTTLPLDRVTVRSDSGGTNAMNIPWTRVCGSLSVGGTVSGNVTFEWQAVTPFTALFDNLDIVASDDPNQLPVSCL
jgi:hypothetical protein